MSSGIHLCICTVRDEAEDQGYDGMLAVSFVILNRAQHPTRWPNRWAGVVTDRKQFSGWNSDAGENRAEMLMADFGVESYRTAARAFLDALAGVADPTMGADHFVNFDVFQPSFATAETFTVKIGDHSFYKRG